MLFVEELDTPWSVRLRVAAKMPAENTLHLVLMSLFTHFNVAFTFGVQMNVMMTTSKRLRNRRTTTNVVLD